MFYIENYLMHDIYFPSVRDNICMSHTFIHAYVNLGVLPFVWEKETGHLLLYHQDEVYITY